MKKLLMVVMASYALTARAQMHESKNFMYLYSDSVVYAKKIMLRPDFSGSWQLRADSRRVPSGQVKFFSNNDGFFANTRKLNFGLTTEFAERIIEGKINIFQEIPYDEFLYDRGYRYGGRPESVIVNLRMYYNKGFDNLKKVNYVNLKTDMVDNSESMDMLNSYRKSVSTSKVLYTAAGASIAAALISFLVKGSNSMRSSGNGFGQQGFGMSTKSPNFTASFVLLGLGAGFAVGGLSMHSSAGRHLERAVDTYNR